MSGLVIGLNKILLEGRGQFDNSIGLIIFHKYL
jgi:hypothetical protein